MDLQTAHALLMVAKKNRVVDVMLTLYKDEVKAFGRVSIMRNLIPKDPVLSTSRRCADEWRERCHAAACELSILQLCAYHNTQNVFGDLYLDRLRRHARDFPGCCINDRARRCRGAVCQLSRTQMCAFCLVRNMGDLRPPRARE